MGSKEPCGDVCFRRSKTDVVLRSQLQFHFVPQQDEQRRQRRGATRRREKVERRCENRDVFYFHFAHVSAMSPCHVRSKPRRMMNHRFENS